MAVSFTDSRGRQFARKGEFVATAGGIEGSLVYAVSALLRDEIAANGSATLLLDLLPDRSAEQVLAAVKHPRGARSLGSHLKSRLGLEGIKAGVLYEVLSREAMHDPLQLAQAIKAVPLRLVAARPVDEAISTAGGVRFEALDAQLMASALPGVFVAGRCSTGKRRPAATCSRPRWPAASRPRVACSRGWGCREALDFWRGSRSGVERERRRS